MGVINTGSFAKALWPGINKWFGDSYKEWPEEYKALFDIETSKKAFEEEVGISGFGLPSVKAEGEGIIYDEARQSFITRYQHKVYALGFVVTREAIEDNQYDLTILGKKDAKALAFSMRQGMEILAANVYNRAFNTNYTFGDGKAICVSDHPTFVGGSFSNVPVVAADLSEAALEQAAIDIAGFKNDRGLAISIMPDKLIIPKELMFEAERILKSTLQNDTTNNAINALKTTGIFKGGVTVNHYLTDTDAWFIRTNCPNAMTMFEREAISFSQDNDFDTKNAKAAAYERYSVGWSDWRGVFGSQGV